MRSSFAALIAAPLLVFATPVLATPADDFQSLLKDHWQWVLSENPELATSLGVRDYDDQIEDISLEARDRSVARAAEFLKRLNAIPAEGLSAADKSNRMILKRNLELHIAANKFPQRTMLFTTYSGWHQNMVGLADQVPLYTLADYESYLARIRQYPKLNDTGIAISNQAIAQGYTLPCVVLGDFEKGISGVIAEDPTKSRYYKPFTQPRPNAISEADWARLSIEARDIVTNVINPAYEKHLEWYRESYLPACASDVGISAQKGGAAYYDSRIKVMTTTDLTADEIHNIGLSEVARIRAEMEKVAASVGFDTREAYIEHLRTDPKYYAKTPEELMRANARQAKALDAHMPKYFGLLPRLPYGIKEIPAEIAEGTTTAYYSSGSPQSGIPGYYYVNTSKLDQRPLWEIPALTAHEAVPGHHHQIALQQEIDLPDFRRYGSFITAFTEGWGLYSERIGIEMGIYDTPEKDMGRLSYEMWRACRLVVDTGIHSKGWSKQQAVDFMLDNTALSAANINAEVNRYISWPAQALGYKIGELKIRELRKRAEDALGSNFDVRAFHDAVLDQGPVPLNVLESQIDAWIANQQAKPAA